MLISIENLSESLLIIEYDDKAYEIKAGETNQIEVVPLENCTLFQTEKQH